MQTGSGFEADVGRSVPTRVAVVDGDGCIAAAGRSAEGGAPGDAAVWAVGRSYEEVCRDAVGSDATTAEALLAGIRGVLTGGSDDFALEFLSEGRWFALRATSLAGEERRAVVSSEDITPRKQAESAIASSEAKFRALYDATGDAVMLFENGRVVDSNAAAARLFGYERAEALLGVAPWELSPETQPSGRSSEELARERIATVLDRGVLRFEWTHMRADGTIFPADVMLGSLPQLGEGRVFQAVVRDITERKRAERAARTSQEALAKAQEIAHLGSWDWNIVTDELAWSDEIYRIFGLMPQEFGATYGAFLERVHPEDRAAVQAAVDVALATQKPYSIEHRVVRPDGVERIVHERGDVTVGPDGEPVRMVGTVQDITDRKEAENEVKRLNEELEQRVRVRTAELQRSNAALEEFAYVVSHDLQEPLRKIVSFGGRLQSSLGGALDERARDYLERMVGASSRMQTLIADLLAFSRLTTRAQPLETVDLGQVAKDVIADLEVRTEEAEATIELGHLPTIQADPLQMRQLLQNLIGNALKFGREDEPPVVRVTAERSDAGWRITVADNGIGFDPKYAERIFGVFQRLHGRSAYEGTGIGLAICRKIAERHAGTITAEGAPGAGARFTVTLPATTAPPRKSIRP